MTTTAPLHSRSPGAIVFHRPGGAVTAQTFLADVARVAASLPPAPYFLNQCQDRYAFAVAFAAGLVAGRVALLNIANADAYPGAIAITDHCLDAPPTSISVPPGAIPEIDCNALAAIVFTSGSTGAPVAHPKRWGSLVQRSRAAASAFAVAPGTTIIGTVPPQHMYGFETTVLIPLHAEIASWCGPAFFPGDMQAAIAACPAPRTLVTTPLHLRTLLDSGIHLPLAAIISATAPLDPSLAARLETAWTAPVHESFGATECGSIAHRRTTATDIWTPYPGIDIALDDEGALVHAPHADPTRLADILEAAPHGVHPNGVRLIGRRTDVIKLAGRRASLPGLDRMLLGIPGVADGAFVVPDAADARPVAVVVAPGRTAAAILADLRCVMEPIFLPRRVIQVDKLPRNALGKLPRQALLALLDQP